MRSQTTSTYRLDRVLSGLKNRRTKVRMGSNPIPGTPSLISIRAPMPSGLDATQMRLTATVTATHRAIHPGLHAFASDLVERPGREWCFRQAGG